MHAVMKLMQDNGGLEGLVSKFQQGGLGEVVQSWISTGPNLPVSPEQLGQALGPDLLRQLGSGGQELLGPLSELLPQVVDNLTPGGQLPEAGGDLGAMLGGLLGGAGGSEAGGANLGGLLGGLLGRR